MQNIFMHNLRSFPNKFQYYFSTMNYTLLIDYRREGGADRGDIKDEFEDVVALV